MAKSESNKQLAERFAAFICALGFTPLPFNHRNEKDYAVALQQQYEELRRTVDPAIAAKARISARAELRRCKLEAASAGPVPTSPSKPRFLPKRHKNRRKLEAFFQQRGNLVLKCPKCRMRCGLPKKSWPTREMAEEALKRSLTPAELHIYECPRQPGCWHVGHRPKLHDQRSESIGSTEKGLPKRT